jgi:hypothetical protein
MYFSGLFTIQILAKYSMVNKMVMIHSNVLSGIIYFILMEKTLSSITRIMLKRITPSRISSKSLPSLVSASKIMLYSFSFNFSIPRILTG